jgi:hypothetical protein
MRRAQKPLATFALLAAATFAPGVQAALPDWPGIWEVVGLKVGASGVAETPVPDLIREFGGRPHYTAEGERQFRSFFEKGPPPDQKACRFGFPFLMLESPLFFEVLITPRETAMIFSGREVRHIYTDGRKHPTPEELWPTPWGDSVGHWEGDTLVIDTVSTDTRVIAVYNASTFGAPVALLSDGVHYVERVRMLKSGMLEDQMTVYDSLFSEPWHITHRYQHADGVNRMIHEDCEGNERNPVVDGKFTLK